MLIPQEYEVANSTVKMLGTWMHLSTYMFICSSSVAGIHTGLHIRLSWKRRDW